MKSKPSAFFIIPASTLAASATAAPPLIPRFSAQAAREAFFLACRDASKNVDEPATDDVVDGRTVKPDATDKEAAAAMDARQNFMVNSGTKMIYLEAQGMVCVVVTTHPHDEFTVSLTG
jgi:hypothetical protein